MSYFGKDFDPTALPVDESLYQPQREGYPNINWMTKVDQHTKHGYWASERTNFPDAPPQYVNWVEHEITYGDNPNEAPTLVYITCRLRCVVIGERFRWVVTDPDGRKHFYPKFTKREDRVEGKLKSHYQAMILLPDHLQSPFILGLPGQVKTLSWDNDPGGQYGNSQFPTGVRQLMDAEAAKMSGEAKRFIHPFCSLWVDLVPALTEKEGGGKAALAIKVGKGESYTYCNPFTADLRLKDSTGKDDKDAITNRFVGLENYRHFQEMRRTIALDWEKEWSEPGEEAASTNYRSQETPVVKEDDEIPF